MSWIECQLLANWDQVIYSLGTSSIDVSIDGSTVDTILDQDETYLVTSGLQVWVQGEESSGWSVCVSGVHDPDTIID